MSDGNEGKLDKKFAQKFIVFSVIGVVVLYYLVTVYLPLLYGMVQAYIERKAILKTVASKFLIGAAENNDEKVAENTADESISQKYTSSAATTLRNRKTSSLKPNFLLTDERFCAESNNAQTNHEQEVQKVSKPNFTLMDGEICNDYTSKQTKYKSREQAVLNPSSLLSRNNVAPNKTANRPSNNISANASLDWRLSAEAPISRPVVDVVRAAQDLEYELSLQEDMRRINEEEAREEARLAILARVLPEPNTDQNVDVISLCFKARQNDTTKAFRIVRNFLSISTWGNVFDFVESLELRPYGSPFEITFGVPITKITRADEDRMLSDLDQPQMVVQINFIND